MEYVLGWVTWGEYTFVAAPGNGRRGRGRGPEQGVRGAKAGEGGRAASMQAGGSTILYTY